MRLEPKTPVWPICPICGSECDTIYKNKYGEIVGCDDCLESMDAYDCPDCYKED